MSPTCAVNDCDADGPAALVCSLLYAFQLDWNVADVLYRKTSDPPVV